MKKRWKRISASLFAAALVMSVFPTVSTKALTVGVISYGKNGEEQTQNGTVEKPEGDTDVQEATTVDQGTPSEESDVGTNEPGDETEQGNSTEPETVADEEGSETEDLTESGQGETEEPETETVSEVGPEGEETEAVTEEESEIQTGESETESEIGDEPESETEIESETRSEPESEAEIGVYETEFRFENEEISVKVTAKEEAKLPLGTRLVVEKLEEGSEEYAKDKEAADAAAGADPAQTSYSFYNMKLISPDDEELVPEEGLLTIQAEFINIKVDNEIPNQNVYNIKNTKEGEKVAENVTVPEEETAEGENLSSIDFEV